ncbi:hypothetical protein K505DRAFT_269393 [Melanomma pulvis-pyrius CBS 109.77]|uniref:Uncharacterized protein n=1 Tax=Melanomma pulvis-pyrius CBS 109.77 TaxID=1314802 RepID=A0A6A6XLM9_9PLEO|nr:hypothetical protein K505DRAFT_269393 [Melanomma pulvis-pyrius CBS 109.77]
MAPHVLTIEESRARKAAFIADIEKEQEFQILIALVQQPYNAPADALKQILNLTAALQNTNPSSSEDSQGSLGHVHNTASSVLEIATRTAPEQQDKLLAFVNQLQKRTVINQKTGEPARYDGDLLWTELPAFGYVFGDELNSKDALDSKNTPEEKQRLENLNAFIAQLTASSTTVYSDFSLWARIALRSAFGPWDIPVASTHYAVRVACLWYIYAADKLWAKVQEKEVSDWNKAYWDRYKQGLVDSEAKIRNQATRQLIEKALVQLRRSEEGGGT